MREIEGGSDREREGKCEVDEREVSAERKRVAGRD